MDLDELEAGYPRMTLTHIHDVVKIIASQVAREEEPPYLETREFHENRDALKQAIAQSPVPGHIGSWRALQGRLGRIKRLGIFDNPRVAPLDYAAILQPGRVSIIDLSDTDSPQVNNLVIAQILRGVQRQQDENYQRAVKDNQQPTPVLVFIEEAHEFLSAQRIKDMPVLFQQVARIARRGRKRWLGLVFITQLPQHLPDEVIGLINNWVLHKINDSNVVSRLRRSIGGIDAALWDRLPNLAPGQAIVSFTSLARPLLVAIDPTPCKLQMVE
jgi:DNA helicase HerA-like ATPase